MAHRYIHYQNSSYSRFLYVRKSLISYTKLGLTNASRGNTVSIANGQPWQSQKQRQAPIRRSACRHNKAMKAFYSDQFVLPLPSGHRFPMAKYQMLRDRLQADFPEVQLDQALRASDDELTLVHSPDYVQSIATGSIDPKAMREIGFPWSEAMSERARRSVGATVAACRSALSEGIAANLAGGTHHSYADRGSGFCVFNDVAVATRLLQAEHAKTNPEPLQVAVIDLDVHQGNGTASIFQGDASVFTLSMHGEKNFPFRKEASDLDIGLPDGCGDADYLHALEQALLALDSRFKPSFVFYLAGADPFEGDRLGRLKLSYEGLQARDRRVFDWAWQRRVPLVMAMAGGYGNQIEETVQVQVNTWREALEHWRRWRG